MFNISLENLASQGSYFIYDLTALRKHAQLIADGAARIFFACKANPLSHILSTLQSTQISFDVASTGELCQVLSLGVKGENIITTGPSKPEKFLRLALANKVQTFVIESPRQLQLLQEISVEYGYQPNVLIRLQLRWEEADSSVLGGNEITAFGMDIDTVKKLLPQIKLPFLGFHVFQWSNILLLNKLEKVWESTIKECKSLTEHFDVLDVGGGLGIPYTNEEPLLWTSVNELINHLKSKYLLKEFWLEMGRYLSAPCGNYLTKVIDRKSTYGKEIIVLENGLNHLLRPALAHEPFPAHLLRESSAPLKNFALHGPLCTSLDFLGSCMLPGDIKEDDVLIFRYTGAYGFTESMPFFLCHDIAGEAIMQDGVITVVRNPQSASLWQR